MLCEIIVYGTDVGVPMPSPGGKVAARRADGRGTAKADITGKGLIQNSNLTFFARIPLQSRFARQLPPGGSHGGSAA